MPFIFLVPPEAAQHLVQIGIMPRKLCAKPGKIFLIECRNGHFRMEPPACFQSTPD
jgi:hypothetical protein